jgi:hypothetical protein
LRVRPSGVISGGVAGAEAECRGGHGRAERPSARVEERGATEGDGSPAWAREGARGDGGQLGGRAGPDAMTGRQQGR